MSVSDWSSAFSTGPNLYETVSDLVVRRKTSTGALISSTTNSATVGTGVRARSFPSHNPPKRVGYSLWRNPSDYKRSVRRLDYSSSANLTALSKAYGETYTITGQYPKDVFSSGYPLEYFTGYLTGTLEQSNVNNRATNRLYGKLTDGSVDSGTNIAESKKTLGEVASLVTDLVGLYKGFKTLNGSLIRKSLTHDESAVKAVAERFLQWQYGVKPLMSDLKSSHDLLRKKLVENHIFGVYGSAHTSQNRVIPFGSFDTNLSQSESLKIQTQVYCEINSSTLLTISKWGLINPLSIAWELTPWSFVIDWLVPVGSTLSALTAPMGYGFRSGTRVTRHETTSQFNIYAAIGTPGLIDSCTGSPFVVKCVDSSYSRSVLPAFPLPGLFVKSPFSTPHILNAAALITSLHK